MSDSANDCSGNGFNSCDPCGGGGVGTWTGGGWTGGPIEAGPGLHIEASGTSFTFENGSIWPEDQVLRFTARISGVEQAVGWVADPAIKTLNGTSQFTLSAAEMGQRRSAVITATAPNGEARSLFINVLADPFATPGAPMGTFVGTKRVEEFIAEVEDTKERIVSLMSAVGSSQSAEAALNEIQILKEAVELARARADEAVLLTDAARDDAISEAQRAFSEAFKAAQNALQTEELKTLTEAATASAVAARDEAIQKAQEASGSANVSLSYKNQIINLLEDFEGESGRNLAEIVEQVGIATTAATNAENAATAASGSAQTASSKATEAVQSASAANVARTDAITAAGNAATSATSAATSATDAAGSASSAGTSSTNAANAAAASGASANAASGSASVASARAQDAEDAASAATTAANNAASSAGSASTSATQAATSATNAAGSASTASTQATNAANSATAAGNSATSANTSASVATTKASEAAQSATSASQSANTASTQASNAESSATSAATSATNAAGSASTATTQATNAANSATAAGNSASSASTSASTATAKATEASQSAASASSSANTATTQAGSASTSANSAASSASSAADSANTATSQASLAASSAHEADMLVRQISRVDFRNGDGHWVYSYPFDKSVRASAPSPSESTGQLTLVNAPGVGQVLRGSGYHVISERTTRPVVQGQTIRVRVKTRLTANRNHSSPHNYYLWIVTTNAQGEYVSYPTIGFNSGMTVAQGWVVHTYTINPHDIRGNDLWTEWSIMLGVNGWPFVGPSGVNETAGEIQEFEFVEVEDVSAQLAAETAANAAATSASVATTKANEAAQSATSASNSANTASTKAGEASSSATSAATAATDAAGSAAAALSSSNVATESKNAALQAATASSESSQSAATAATLAEQGATAANTAKTAAETAASNASSSASQASTSAQDAAGSAASAQTSSGAAAQSKTDAQNAASASSTSAQSASTSATDAQTAAGNAAASASAANTARTAAETASSNAAISRSDAVVAAQNAAGSAAAALSSSVLAASVGTSAINKNPGFDDYPSDSQGATPSNWSGWMGGTWNRVPGIDGGYSIKIVGPAGEDCGIIQITNNTIKFNDWLVIEADVTLNSGTFTSAGVLVYTITEANNFAGDDLRITFTTDADETGNPVGLGVPGRTYRFRKLVRVSGVNAYGFYLYAMSKWSGLGNNDISGANDITWHKLMMRPATPAEVAAGNVLPAVQASVSQLQGAVADIEGSAAFLETKVAANGSTPALMMLKAGKTGSGIGLVADKIALGNNINGQVVDALVLENGNAYFNGMLRAGSVRVADISRGPGQNLLKGAIPGSNPARWMVQGWNPDGVQFALSNGTIYHSRVFATSFGPEWTLDDNSTVAIHQNNAQNGGHGVADFHVAYVNTPNGAMSDLHPIEAGKNYEFSVYTGAHRCTVTAHIFWFDGSGDYIGEIASAGNNSQHSGGRFLSGYMRNVVRGVAPSTAGYAKVGMRKGHTLPGSNDSWLFFNRPMFAETTPNASEAMAYSYPSSGFLHAEAILANSIEARAIAAGAVTAEKMSVTSLSAISANIGVLRTAASGARTELRDNRFLVYDSNNVLRVEIGQLS